MITASPLYSRRTVLISRVCGPHPGLSWYHVYEEPSPLCPYSEEARLRSPTPNATPAGGGRSYKIFGRTSTTGGSRRGGSSSSSDISQDYNGIEEEEEEEEGLDEDSAYECEYNQQQQ